MNLTALYTQSQSKLALRGLTTRAQKILSESEGLSQLSDAALASTFQGLKETPAEGRIEKGFALVREASRRTTGMAQFLVQLVGGLALLKGRLAEMRTGEGKTLTIVAPAALLALEGKGVHVVTANTYLATRDAEAMRPIYAALGLTVAAIDPQMTQEQKKQAYEADITYGVGFEFGFDYLRDNQVSDLHARVQRPLYAAIVDEVDSILIDEAGTPLILSGSADTQESTVRAIDGVVGQLVAGTDFQLDLKERTATLTEQGYEQSEALLVTAGVIPAGASLYAADNLHLLRRLHAAVRARGLFKRDRDYVVASGEIVLVDLGSGRKMPGRRLEEGLHEALEAKEGLVIQASTVTRATITYQSYFGLYTRLAGLTGTALTEAEEFSEFYGLETVVIPPNKPSQREAHPDQVFATKADKFSAAVRKIAELQASEQPVLVGCATVRDAEVLSELLNRASINHEVLTAKHLEREAHIIANAGRPRAVTVSTNMAGRGTDILLGGEKPSSAESASADEYAESLKAWEISRDIVLAKGGLFVLGTERSGIRRVDNQLAGRAGRQGDVGQVQFLLSLEDDLFRNFGGGKALKQFAQHLNAGSAAMEGKLVSRFVSSCQQKVEAQGFNARRELMKYDKVLSDQRKAVYSLRNLLLTEGVDEYCQGAIAQAVDDWIAENMPENSAPEHWELPQMARDLAERFDVTPGLAGWIHREELSIPEIGDKLREAVYAHYADSTMTADERKHLIFTTVTELWTEHLSALDTLRKSAGLKATTGLNPMFQFGKDAFALFESMQSALCAEVAKQLLSRSRLEARREQLAAEDALKQAYARVAKALDDRWVRRNESCPCGSGLAYKRCHGKLS